MSRAVGVVDGKPLFIAAICWCDICPRLAAIHRSPQVVEEILEQAEIKEMACTVRVQNRIAAKNIGLENAGGNPRPAAIDRVRESRLSKIR